MKQNQQTIWVIGALLIAAGIAPWVLPTYYLYLLNLILINIILALGLNVLTGNSGQISLCHSSFMAIGAYTYTLLNNHSQLPMLLCVLGAVLLASLGGVLVGYPARRLSGIYLALATLAFLSLTQILIEEFPDVQGSEERLMQYGRVPTLHRPWEYKSRKSSWWPLLSRPRMPDLRELCFRWWWASLIPWSLGCLRRCATSPLLWWVEWVASPDQSLVPWCLPGYQKPCEESKSTGIWCIQRFYY